jgi:hypothetical protein
MHTHETSPDDPQARAELVRLARIMRGEGAARALDEFEHLAARVEALAQGGPIGSRAAAELDAAVERLVVLADRTPQHTAILDSAASVPEWLLRAWSPTA